MESGVNDCVNDGLIPHRMDPLNIPLYSTQLLILVSLVHAAVSGLPLQTPRHGTGHGPTSQRQVDRPPRRVQGVAGRRSHGQALSDDACVVVGL